MPAGPAAASQLYYLSRRPGGSLSLSLPVIYFANDARLYHGVFPTKSSSLLSEWVSEWCMEILMLCPVGNVLHQTAANLYHFLWWRVVCDEAHELITYDNVRGPSDGLRTVLGFQSRHRWYVTGTPFPHGLDSLRAALQVRLLPVRSAYFLEWCDRFASNLPVTIGVMEIGFDWLWHYWLVIGWQEGNLIWLKIISASSL